jgi:hypothetical protein
MKRLQIERKITVWTTEFIEYDDTKYTEEEFVNQFHRVENGYSDVPLSDLYETYEHEVHQHSADEITPAENGGVATLIIMDEEGDEIYDNHSKIYKEEKIKS